MPRQTRTDTETPPTTVSATPEPSKKAGAVDVRGRQVHVDGKPVGDPHTTRKAALKAALKLKPKLKEKN